MTKLAIQIIVQIIVGLLVGFLWTHGYELIVMVWIVLMLMQIDTKL